MTSDTGDNPTEETPAEPSGESDAPQFAFHTPSGVFASTDDLPPEARRALLSSIDQLPIPDVVRDALREQLERHADETAPDAAARPLTREQIWAVLDAAFPREPHLWQAGEMLLGASSQPADTQAVALELAIEHIQRHQKLAGRTATLSPTEQLIQDFRAQIEPM